MGTKWSTEPSNTSTTSTISLIRGRRHERGRHGREQLRHRYRRDQHHQAGHWRQERRRGYLERCQPRMDPPRMSTTGMNPSFHGTDTAKDRGPGRHHPDVYGRSTFWWSPWAFHWLRTRGLFMKNLTSFINVVFMYLTRGGTVRLSTRSRDRRWPCHRRPYTTDHPPPKNQFVAKIYVCSSLVKRWSWSFRPITLVTIGTRRDVTVRTHIFRSSTVLHAYYVYRNICVSCALNIAVILFRMFTSGIRTLSNLGIQSYKRRMLSYLHV